MRPRDLVREAIVSVVARPLRTILVGLGTVLGVGGFVATLGLAETARQQVSSAFDAARATEIQVVDARPDGSNPFPSASKHAPDYLQGFVAGGVEYDTKLGPSLVPRRTAQRSDHGEGSVHVLAADPGTFTVFAAVVRTGRLFDDWLDNRAEPVAILGSTAAAALGINWVDGAPAVFVGSTSFVVIGILQPSPHGAFNSALIIPATTAKRSFPMPDARPVYVARTRSGAAQLVARQLPVALRPNDPDRLQVIAPPDARTLRRSVERNVERLVLSLAAVAIAVGAFSILNATMLSVVERRSEIGLRRAVGASRLLVAGQFAIESLLLGAGTGAAGGIGGLLVVLITSVARGWIPTINPLIVLAAPVVGSAVGVLAGIAPAIRAARVAPSEALRSV